MPVSVILPAAGKSSRFQARSTDGTTAATASKIEHRLGSQPMFMHAIRACRSVGRVGQIILAVAPDRFDDFSFRFGDQLDDLGVTLVEGGTLERWETVCKAMEKVEADATHIAVHDAARPCLTTALFDRLLDAAEELSAVIPGVPVSSTLKKAEAWQMPKASGGAILDIIPPPAGLAGKLAKVQHTVNRQDVYAIQTPQVFERSLLERAYAGVGSGTEATDDAGLVEALGEPVYILPGESTNLKITTPEDAELAEAILRLRDETQKRDRAVDVLFGDDED
jgi:2-C-methyl-D-erythritol 4-phosphate cytidylyltransferase